MVRDVGRVLEMPFGQVNKLCKLVPNNPANPVTLEQAIEGEPQLQEARDREPVVKQLLDMAKSWRGFTDTPRPTRPASSSATGRWTNWCRFTAIRARVAGHAVQHEKGGAGGACEVRLPGP